MAADRGGRQIVEGPSDSLISLTKEVLPSLSEARFVDVKLDVNDFEALESEPPEHLFSIIWRKSGLAPVAAGAPVMVMVGISAVAKEVRFRWKCTLPLGEGIAMPTSQLNVGACPTRNWALACSFRTAHKTTAPMAPATDVRRCNFLRALLSPGAPSTWPAPPFSGKAPTGARGLLPLSPSCSFVAASGARRGEARPGEVRWASEAAAELAPAPAPAATICGLSRLLSGRSNCCRRRGTPALDARAASGDEGLLGPEHSSAAAGTPIRSCKMSPSTSES
mmetsp:Transcript_36625/g.94792  ORF Transcript_36625/g.94792 Transcript_36625/m.94792 type:complete len:279 (+) Transcript_36625:89-925(+)